MNNNVSQEFTSLKWEVKNTYFIMPVRRLFYPPSLWRIGGPAPIHIHEKFPSQRLSKNSL
jgi:hypothetical protein